MTMANVYTNPFIHNIGLDEENLLSYLLDQISPEIENETTVIEHSKHYNEVEFKNVLQNANSKISILSFNCQSINAKFSFRYKYGMSNIGDMYSVIMGSRRH